MQLTEQTNTPNVEWNVAHLMYLLQVLDLFNFAGAVANVNVIVAADIHAKWKMNAMSFNVAQ